MAIIHELTLQKTYVASLKAISLIQVLFINFYNYSITDLVTRQTFYLRFSSFFYFFAARNSRLQTFGWILIPFTSLMMMIPALPLD